MIVYANTVIDPWAMMIKSLDTSVANTAMTGSISSHDLAIRAQKHRVKDLHHFHEGYTLRALEVPRVLAHRPHMQ